MKDLNITINGIGYTDRQINQAQMYSQEIFGATLESLLICECLSWIDRAIEQIEKRGKIIEQKREYELLKKTTWEDSLEEYEKAFNKAKEK